MVHSIDIKVRGYHLDGFGHVNNARYLEFLEEARWAAFEEKVDLQQWAGRGYMFTVVNININYRRPAYINEVLHIETSIAKLGRRSGVVRQEISLQGTDNRVADADVTFVLFDTRQQRTALLEGDLLEALQGV
jgi:thioesterase-3